MALVDIAEYQKMVAQSKQNLDTIEHTKPSSAGLVITEAEIADYENFESRMQGAVQQIATAEKKLEEAEKKFFALLPKSVHEEMQTEGKSVYASWVEQDMSQRQYGRQYGPYAAYFVNDKLQVELFTDYHQFVTRFEKMREQEDAESHFTEDFE